MTPEDRITAYFDACGNGTAADIASHFTTDAVIYDTNVRPISAADGIGEMWCKVRRRWNGAQWTVDSIISDAGVAAIEWSMTGTSSVGEPFVFHGSEHYLFYESLIAEIRQYWSFDPDKLDTGLIGFPYEQRGS